MIGLNQEATMGYSAMDSVDEGKDFVSPAGLSIRTTGTTVLVDSHDMYVHEVEITDGVGEGNRYLLNLDSAQES